MCAQLAGIVFLSVCVCTGQCIAHPYGEGEGGGGIVMQVCTATVKENV